MTTYAQPDVEEEEDEEEDGAVTPQGVHLSMGPAGWSPLVPHAPLLTIPTHTRAHEHTHTIRLHSRQSPFPFPPPQCHFRTAHWTWVPSLTRSN